MDEIWKPQPLYLNHFTERVRLNYWGTRDHVVPISDILVEDRSLREKVERLRVLLAEAFGDREAVDVGARATFHRLHLATEQLHGTRVARDNIS